MFGIKPKLIGAALIAASLLASGAYVFGRLDGAALTDAAVERSLKQATRETDNAIDELADKADRARLGRHNCRDRGGVWSFADNECGKAETQP